MPVRKIPMNYRHVTGRYAFPNGKSVAFEAPLERDFLYLMDFDPDVAEVEEQPVKVPVPGGRGRASYYVPDYLVKWRGGQTWLVEVKLSSDLKANRSKYKAKFKAAKTYAADRGWEFKIITDQDIRTPKLKNIRFLLSYRRRNIDPGVSARLLGHASDDITISLGQILERAFPDPSDHPAVLPALWNLVVSGHLNVDMETQLDLNSMVMPESGGAHENR